MSAHRFGNEVKEARRYRLGKALGQVSRHLLLMTATPHHGKDEDFQLFLALLDPDRFEGKPGLGAAPDVSDLMRRMVKALFPEHRDTLNQLVSRLRTFLGRDDAVVAIDGGVRREERRRIQELFRQDRTARSW